MHWKTANSPQIKKAEQNQNSRQCQLFFFMLRGLSCSFFFIKIQMKRYVDAKGEYIKGETK